MKVIYLVIGLVFLSSNVQAKDLLPHRMKTQQGQIQTMTDQDLTAIDNQALYLQPTNKGKFNSSFYYKKKDMNGSPYLDIRISFQTGTYEFQVLQDQRWVSLGSVDAKTDWQRVKFDLPAQPSDLAHGKKNFKIRILGRDKPSAAKLDYMGVSIDLDVAQRQ